MELRHLSSARIPTDQGCALRMQGKLFGFWIRNLLEAKPVQALVMATPETTTILRMLDAFNLQPKTMQSARSIFREPGSSHLEETAKIMCQGIDGRITLVPFLQTERQSMGDLSAITLLVINLMETQRSFEEGVQLPNYSK